MNFRLAICALAVSFLGAGLGAGCGGSGDRPNVVLVVLDTTRADLLSAYDFPAPTTPHLESIARDGIRFTRAFSTDFWTLPAHASLLTGLYPSDHGATSETNLLAPESSTLAERLRAHGYRTAAFVSNPWLSRETGFGQGFERFDEMWRGKTRHGRTDRAGAERAAAWIEERSAAGEPFFLFVNFNFAHLPYSPDPMALSAVVSRPHSVDRSRKLKKVVGTWEYLAGAYELRSEDFELLRDLYLGELRMVDDFVAEVDHAIEDAGVRHRTLLLVTSDHGENLGDHGLIDHMLSMYDTTIRVPLVARLPGRIAAGSESDELVSGIDVMPTVLAAAGIPHDDLPGRSLLAGGAPPEFVVAENERPLNGMKLLERNYPGFDTSRIDGPMRMLRTSRFKLIASERGVELYDLEQDPHEEHDLSSDRPELVASLKSKLEAWQSARTGVAAGQATNPLLDREAREQLRALGYVE